MRIYNYIFTKRRHLFGWFCNVGNVREQLITVKGAVEPITKTSNAGAEKKTRKFRNPYATVIIHYTNKQFTPRVFTDITQRDIERAGNKTVIINDSVNLFRFGYIKF